MPEIPKVGEQVRFPNNPDLCPIRQITDCKAIIFVTTAKREVPVELGDLKASDEAGIWNYVGHTLPKNA